MTREEQLENSLRELLQYVKSSIDEQTEIVLAVNRTPIQQMEMTIEIMKKKDNAVFTAKELLGMPTPRGSIRL